MPRYLLTCSLYAACAVATTWTSSRTVGFGVWGQAMLIAATVVVASAFLPRLRPLARAVGAVSAALSALAVGLGLLAGTIGGSFHISPEGRTLLAAFACLSVLGLGLSRTGRPPA